MSMNGRKYILSKQLQWAHRHGLALQGRSSAEGNPNYTINIKDNLFEPLSEEALVALKAGHGNELKPQTGSIPKIQALHSSAALVINVLQYWHRMGDIGTVPAACGLCSQGHEPATKLTSQKLRCCRPKSAAVVVP